MGRLLLLIMVMVMFLVGCLPVIGVRPFVYTQREFHSSEVQREIPIWVDGNFGAADQVEIAKAVSAWNYALNGYIHLTVVDTSFDMEVSKIREQDRLGGWLVMKTNSRNKMIPLPGISGNRTVGWSDVVGGHHMWLIRDRMFNDDVVGICLHEMGHLLGAHHAGHRLMDPTYTQDKGSCIDLVSMRMVAEYNHLPADRLNYCVLLD